MKIKEAKKLTEELKGRFDFPFNSFDKSSIEKLYDEVLGKTFVPTTCQQCYHDALIEIYLHLKNTNKMPNDLNYRLKAGAIINCPDFKSGKIFTNDNLTDKIAASYLKKYPNAADLFQKLPDAEKLQEDENNSDNDDADAEVKQSEKEDNKEENKEEDSSETKKE